MRGEVPLEDVYGHRLELIRPSRERMALVARRYIEALVPDARETVAALRAEGVAVRVLSGGLLPAVAALAESLGIARADVEAVDIRFDADGRYIGFDTTSPLARSGGKLEVLARWRPALPAPVMLVGDGATDLEGRPAVDAFVGFAGVIARGPVVAAADVVIHARSLAPVFALAMGDDAPSEPARRSLYERGRSMMAERTG